MTVSIRERPSSRQVSYQPPRAMREYTITGTSDELYALSLAMGYSPGIVATTDSILYRQDVQIQESGHRLWTATVPYGEKQKENGSYTFSFDTTGGTVRVRTSKSTVNKYPGTAADHKQLINVKKDGEVEGADIIIPALKLNIEFSHPLGVVTMAHAKALARLTGCVNDTDFLTFDGGEVLFLGATGSDGSEAPAVVNYQFACSQNATGLTIGSISSIEKDGHDLIWVSYEDYDDSGKAAVRPLGVYVERVYTRVNLASALGFGG